MKILMLGLVTFTPLLLCPSLGAQESDTEQRTIVVGDFVYFPDGFHIPVLRANSKDSQELSRLSKQERKDLKRYKKDLGLQSIESLKQDLARLRELRTFRARR